MLYCESWGRELFLSVCPGVGNRPKEKWKMTNPGGLCRGGGDGNSWNWTTLNNHCFAFSEMHDVWLWWWSGTIHRICGFTGRSCRGIHHRNGKNTIKNTSLFVLSGYKEVQFSSLPEFSQKQFPQNFHYDLPFNLPDSKIHSAVQSTTELDCN